MNFSRCFVNQRVVAFTRTDLCNCVFVFEVPADKALPVDPLDETSLLADWSGAVVSGGVRHAAIYFFPLITDDPLATAGQFVQALAGNRGWDSIGYWSDSKPASGSIRFPNGDETIFEIGQIDLDLLQGDTKIKALALSELTAAWNGTRLGFRSTKGLWTILDGNGNLIAQSDTIEIDFADPAPHPGGALQVRINAGAEANLPCKISYSRVSLTGDTVLQCTEVLAGAVVSALHPTNPHAYFALDPRDTPDGVFAAQSQQSRIEFVTGLPFTSFHTTDKGAPVLLQAADSSTASPRGRAVLRFEVSQGVVSEGKWDFDPTGISFIPDGNFVFSGVNGGTTAGLVHNVITGSTATEYVPLAVGSKLTFHSTKPAVIRGPQDAPPPSKAVRNAPADATPGVTSDATSSKDVGDLFHDGQGLITTAWFSVTHPTGSPVEFHSEPEKSPLFAGAPAPPPPPALPPPASVLARANKKLGNMADPMPIFPWAGAFTYPTQDASGQPVADYEMPYLAEARRRLANRGGVAAQDAAPGGSFGVTPQGIVTQLSGDDFSKLFFGNPDTSTPGAAEFSISIEPGTNDGQKAAYDQFQRALRANDLFVVINEPQPEFAAVIELTAEFDIRGFTFDFNVDASAQGNPTKIIKSPFILKYYKNKSLKDLLADEKLWACKAGLAPTTAGGDIQKFINIAGIEPAPGTNLYTVWTDPNWQGVLMLDLNPNKMPDLFDALRPGMPSGGLRVHHAGLNFLTVKSVDTQSTPLRLGAAFGLLRYTGGDDGAQPTAPTAASGDHLPGDNNAFGSKYTFQVTKLEVEFANSAVRTFNAEVTVSFSHFFWDQTTDNPAKLTLTGSYESRPATGGGSTDIFSLTTQGVVTISFNNSWLDNFTITKGEFVVTRSDSTSITTFLGLNGQLNFVKNPEVDFFSVDSITLQRAGLEFKSDKGSGANFSCRFRADNIKVDIDFGDPKNSLLSILPVSLKGFRMAIDKLIDFPSLGYLPIKGKDTKLYFAFDLELDCGFLGDLAGTLKGLKVPMLLGWSRGGNPGDGSGIGLGISFPNYSSKPFEIGFEQFLAIKADDLELKTCKTGDTINSLAILLDNARLELFGIEFPGDDDEISFVLFVPVGSGGRKMAWAFCYEGDDWLSYLGAGQRIKAPDGHDTDELVDSFKNILTVPSGKKLDPCSLQAAPGNNGWTVAADFTIEDLVHAKFIVCDSPTLYALKIELPSVENLAIEAEYKRITDKLGMFATEFTLPDSLREFQVGAATLRLPVFGLEVYTDGGFAVDLGYPWNNDYTRCFQLEIAIFLGSGGIYFAYTSAAAAGLLALDKPNYGYSPPDPAQMDKFQAISAKMASRAGIGRTFELGILSGEASMTATFSLEGSVAYLKGSGSRDPKLFAIRGTVGLMLRIAVEVNFVVLRATAEFTAFIQAGLEIARVLGKGSDGGHYYLTLPITIFADVGIYVHVEVWVTIGCVRVKLFDLTFSGTWHFEEPIGPLKAELFEAAPIVGNAVQDSAPTVALPPALPDFSWGAGYQLYPKGTALTLFVSLLPCAIDPLDLPVTPANNQFQPGLVMQCMLKQSTDFLSLAKFMLGWVMNIDAGTGGDARVYRAQIIQRRRQLQQDDFWIGGKSANNIPLKTVTDQFAVTPKQVPMQHDDYAALPGWPGMAWKFLTDEKGKVTSANTPVQTEKIELADDQGQAFDVDGLTCTFVDYLRALTLSLLSQTDRVIRTKWNPKNGDPDAAFLTWDDLWEQLFTPPGN